MSLLASPMIFYAPGIVLPSPPSCIILFLCFLLCDHALFPSKCRAALRQSMSYWKEKLGQISIDLGIAPQKLESYQNGETKFIDPMEKLKYVRGHLVSFPLEFMRDEDLRPVFNEGEFYASPQVFH